MRIEGAKILDRFVGRILLAALRPIRALSDVVRGYTELRGVREIAVVKFWGIGNAALLLPLLRALKSRYPAARLTVVTLEPNRALFRGVADRLLTVRTGSIGQAALDLVAVLGALRRVRVDIALDFEQYVRVSQVICYLAGIRQVIAFDTAGQSRAELAEVKVKYDDERHCGESYLELARAAGVRERRYEPGGLEVTPEAAARVDSWRRDDTRPLVVLHPGSGDNFPGRRWPTRRFGLLARRLVDEGAVVAVTGSRSERPLVREVVEASDGAVFDLCGRLDLEELVALIARASVVVCNDTGPVHVASALGVPVVGLYGPNTPRVYGPLAPLSVAFYDAPACSPCITNFNYKTSRCLNPVCIRAIEVEAVAAAALRLLAARAERRA